MSLDNNDAIPPGEITPRITTELWPLARDAQEAWLAAEQFSPMADARIEARRDREADERWRDRLIAAQFDPGPELWCHEEDGYTNAGDEMGELIKQAVRQIVGPAMAAGADAMHVAAIAVEAASRACNEEWTMRNDIR